MVRIECPFRRDAGLSRNALIGIAGAAVLVIVALVVLLLPGEEPPAVVEETGPDPAELARRAREAKIAKIVEETEALEAGEEFEKALLKIREALKLDPKHARVMPVESRIAATVQKLNGWRSAHKRVEAAQKTAEGRDTEASWKAVLSAVDSAEKAAPTPTFAKQSSAFRTGALLRRDWAAARELGKKGDLDGALRLVDQAIAAAEPPAALTAFKAELEKKKRKKAYDKAAILARNETNPAKAIDLWRKAQPLADRPEDVKEAKDRIDALLPRVDLKVRDERFSAAVKRGEAALAKGDLVEAEKSYREAAKLKGGDAQARQGLMKVTVAKRGKAYEAAMAEGRAHEEKGNWYGAVKAYERALRSKGRDKAAMARLKEIEAMHRPRKITVVLDATNRVTMDFVLVEPGKFTMGDRRGLSSEAPHEVTITKDCWMQTTEVTKRQWEAIIPAKTPVSLADANLPAEAVSWTAVQAWIKALNERSKVLGGRVAGLPTEAEWEYACRAGTKPRWPFGDSDSQLTRYGWFERNSTRRIHAVKGREPNAWGLYDMHGNVAEWCEDIYGRYAGPASDPTGAKTGDDRVVRGGSWNDRSDACRSAARGQAKPERRSMSIGFRLVLR